MATPQTQQPQTKSGNSAAVAATAASTRKKKGEGPVSVLFIDNDNKEHKRVPAGVHSVVVADRHNHKKQYTLSNLPPAVLHQLAADALKKRFDTYGRNSANEKGDNIIESTDKLFDNIKKGQINLKGEGKGGPGKKFDFDLWIDTMELATKLQNEKNPKVKVMTQKNKEAMRAKLEAQVSSERAEQVKKWMSNSIFKLSNFRVKARREEKNALEKTGDFDMSDAY